MLLLYSNLKPETYKQRVLETSFFLNYHSMVENELVLMYELLNSEKFPANPFFTDNTSIYDNFELDENVSLNESNLIFLARLLDPNSNIYKLYWPAIAQAYHESIDLLSPLSASDYVNILKILKKEDEQLFSSFKNHISVNGFLKQSSSSDLIRESDLRINKFVTGKGVTNINKETLEKTISSDYGIIFDSIMLLQGLTPRSGYGRDKLISRKNSPSENDLSFLSENDLIIKMKDFLSKEYEEDHAKGWEAELEERYERYLSEPEYDVKKQHETQLSVLTSGLENLIRKLKKFHSNYSEDQVYLHRNSIEEILIDRAESLTTNDSFFQEMMEGLGIWAPKYEAHEAYETFDPTAEFISAFSYSPHSKNEKDGGFYSIIINALYYLYFSLLARLLFIGDKRETGIDATSLSLLAGFSTDRTIKNELTRKNSSLERAKKEKGRFLLYGKISIESARKWLQEDKRKLKFKDIVHSGDFKKELNYLDLKKIYDDFCLEYKNIHKTPFSKTKKMDFRNMPENRFQKTTSETSKNPLALKPNVKNKLEADFLMKDKDGTLTIVEIKKHLKTRDRILNALNRNKHKKTKSELELLEKFYAESETYKRI